MSQRSRGASNAKSMDTTEKTEEDDRYVSNAVKGPGSLGGRLFERNVAR